jgi:hypothetical protein
MTILITVHVTIKSKYIFLTTVGVPGYRSRGPGTILGATKFSEK